ncbi:tetratricopeptide repeat protein [Paraburkholderia hospita]|nr:tetratricopeptide repeat protein [Paraburkholderia hospita]
MLAIPFCVLVLQDTLTRQVRVPPVVVPQSFLQRGYTSEMLSDRILSAMRKISTESELIPHDADIGDGAKSDFKIPGEEMSYASVVDFLKKVFGREDVLVHISIAKLNDGLEPHIAHIRIEHGQFDGISSDVHQSGQNLDDFVNAVATKAMQLVEPIELANHEATAIQKTQCSPRKCNYGKVEAIYEDVLARPGSPQRQWALAGKGWLLITQNRSTEAERQIRDAISEYPHSAILRATLGIALEQQHRIDDALSELIAGTHEKSRTAENERLLGDVFLHATRYDDALAAFERADRMRPHDPNTLHDYGEALVKAGRYDEAVKKLTHAVRIRPDLAPSYAELGRALEHKGDFHGAATMYAQALKRDTGSLDQRETRMASWEPKDWTMHPVKTRRVTLDVTEPRLSDVALQF